MASAHYFSTLIGYTTCTTSEVLGQGRNCQPLKVTQALYIHGSRQWPIILNEQLCIASKGDITLVLYVFKWGEMDNLCRDYDFFLP